MYNFNETEMKNFADDIKAKTILEMETKAVPSNIITGGGLAVEKADKQTKFRTWLNAKYNNDTQILKALSGSYTLVGGVNPTLPTEFATEMWNKIFEYSLSNYCTNYKVGTGQLYVQTLSTKPVVASVGQGAAMVDAGAINESKSIPVTKYAAYQTFSKEMLDDNNYDLYGHLLKTFAEAIAKKMDAVIVEALDAGATGVDGGAGAEITLANLLSFYTGGTTAAAPANKNSIWALSRSTYGKILGLVTAGTGIFTNVNSLSNPTLLGYPVLLSETIDAYATANGSKWGYFGDFANVGFASRQEMEAELIKEGTLNAVSLAETRQVALVVDARFGAKVLDANGVIKMTA